MNLSLPAKKENLRKGLLHFPQHPRLRNSVGSGEGPLAPGIRYAITQLEKHLRILFNSGPRSWRRVVTGAQHADLVALRLMLTLSDSWLLGMKKFNSFPLSYYTVCIYVCMHVPMYAHQGRVPVEVRGRSARVLGIKLRSPGLVAYALTH